MTSQPSELDRAVLAMIQQARRSTAGQADAPEACDYDWTTPRRFTPDQLQRLDAMIAAAAGRLGATVSRMLPDAPPIDSATMRQHYRPGLLADSQDRDEMSLPLVGDGKPAGLLAFTRATAVAWVETLLGGSPGAGATRELSSLEAELLADAAAAVAEAFTAGLQGGSLKVDGELVGGLELPPGGAADEFCRVDFHAGGQPAGVAIIVAGEWLAAALGAPTKAAKPGDARKDLLSAVGRASVRAGAALGDARLPMRHAMSLEVGDVLVLDRRIDEPVDLLVQGRRVLSGYLVACGECLGLQVTAGPAK